LHGPRGDRKATPREIHTPVAPLVGRRGERAAQQPPRRQGQGKGAAMNQRERVLAIGVLCAVVLGGGAFLFHSMVWGPLQELDTSIASVQKEVEQKEQRVRNIQAAKVRMERWKLLSLPDDQDFA